MSQIRDFYEILGVSRSATDARDRRPRTANSARQYHPDANPGDEGASEHFKEISVAYEALSDPEKRRRYDMFGPEGVAPGAGAGGGDDFGFGLNDLFDAFFSRPRPVRQRAGRTPGRLAVPTPRRCSTSHSKKWCSAAPSSST